MKNSSPGTKLLMAAICLVVLAYFGVQAWRYFTDPLTMATAYSYEVEESAAATGYLVRDEKVLPDSGGGELQLRYQEGEKVGVNDAIATVYADQASLQRQNQIETLTTQLEQLRYAQEAAQAGEVSLKLDTQITRDIVALRANLAADRLESADGNITELRALVLKRDYTYSGGDPTAKIQELESQLKTLKAQTASAAKAVRAPVSGVYSAVVDGYETVLTPAGLDDLTPDALSSVQKDSSVASDVGKLILGDAWYYAAVLSAKDAASLAVGQSVTLRFAKGAERDFRVTVRSLSGEEGGRVAVVFTGRQYLSEVTLLRQQSADVIRSTVSGVRVPQNALRVSKSGQTGLYCVVGMVARFKPVTVVYRGDDFILVQSASEQEKTRLRPGDQVLITSGELYDGMVVSEASQ
jgi:outer membrane murein-binding lipoprotein Lpp